MHFKRLADAWLGAPPARPFPPTDITKVKSRAAGRIHCKFLCAIDSRTVLPKELAVARASSANARRSRFDWHELKRVWADEQ